MENIIRYLPEGINLYILLFVIGSILYLWKRFGGDPSRSKSLPSLFTIIGVFGTFLGIVLGLADFDVTSGRVEESVSVLLDGLKFAFWTSVAGIISAIAIRIKNLLSAPGIHQYL